MIVRRYEEGKGELVHVLSGEQVKEIKREGGWPFADEFAFEEENDESADDTGESVDEYEDDEE